MFLHQLVEDVSKERGDGTHVSDVIHPLITYWSRVLPKPHTEASALFFLVGRGTHGVVEPYFGALGIEKRMEYKGIFGTVDAHDYDEVIVEIKGTRKITVRKKPDDSFIEQLMAYCAFLNKNHGRIVTLYYAPKDIVPDVTVDDVFFTDEELNIARKQLELNALALKIALEKRDPKALTWCPVSMCTYCRWNDVCEGASRLR